MKNEPVLTAAGLAGVVMSGLAMAVALGVIKLDEMQMGSIQTFLLAFLPLVLTVGAALWARKQVTPLNDPRTKAGEPATLIAKLDLEFLKNSVAELKPLEPEQPEQ